MSLRLEALEISGSVLDKIESKHRVSFEEVEQACLSTERHVRKGREGSYKVFSQTLAGRYLLVILVDLGEGVWKVVTARDMNDSEKHLYNRVSIRK